MTEWKNRLDGGLFILSTNRLHNFFSIELSERSLLLSAVLPFSIIASPFSVVSLNDFISPNA